MLIWYLSRRYQPYCHLYQFCRVETGKRNYAIAVRELRQDEQLQDLEPLLSFFASFVLDIPLVQQIMRWDMTVLRESPWYEEILKEGLQQGKKQGLQQGRLEGETQLVIRQLQRRLGTLDDTLKQQIQMLPVEQLESLAEELLDFRDVEQLQTWLEQLSSRSGDL